MNWYKIYITDTVKKPFSATASMWRISILPQYKNDKGLLEHEKIHVKQWWKNIILHNLLYKYNSYYRLRCEVEAYKEQLKYSSNDIDHFAYFISTRYDLDISTEEALKLLLE